MRTSNLFQLATLAALLTAPGAVFAQGEPPAEDADPTAPDPTSDPEPMRTRTIGEGTPSRDLPPPTSDRDPRPPAPAPEIPTGTGVTSQAGVGGTQAYGRAGVLELGGNVGFNAANEFSHLVVGPTFGWFFMDNVELSLLLNYNRLSTDDESTSYFTGLVEPSLHIPVNDVMFVFAGIGGGVSHAEGPGTGFAVAPRAGLNILVGRSGLLSPAFTFVYSTSDAVQTPQGTLLAVNTSYGLNVGYTVMW